MALGAGTRLGPYEIQAAIGAGGMGEVYRARDTRLDRTVAIKVVPSHVSDDPAVRERFEREARAVAALNHPHICTLHDVGHQDGVDFLVMEHLDGESLAQRLTKGPLSLDSALRYAIEIVDALDKAHRAGIVHRDLKPGNIMITRTGAKLLDFGWRKPRLPSSPRRACRWRRRCKHRRRSMEPSSGRCSTWLLNRSKGKKQMHGRTFSRSAVFCTRC